MQSRSWSVKLIGSVTKKPLLRMLRWLTGSRPWGSRWCRDVYWMLIGSPGSSVGIRSASTSAASASPSATSASQSSVPM